MSAQDARALVRRFLRDVIERRDLGTADAVQSAEYTLHMPGLPGPVRGLAAWKGVISSYFAAFPDLEVILEDDISEGERVAIRYTWCGTQRNAFMGVPAGGASVRVSGMAVFRVANGRIAEEWHQDDTLGLLQQLGAIPAPGPGASATDHSRIDTRHREVSGSIEEHKAIVRRYLEEVVNGGDREAAGAVLAPDVAWHLPGMPDLRGLDGDAQLNAMFRGSFPDARVTVHDMVAEGDKVATRLSYRGSHRGEFQGIPATGRPMEMCGMQVARIADGKIAEAWALPDMLGLLQQIGAISPRVADESHPA